MDRQDITVKCSVV